MDNFEMYRVRLEYFTRTQKPELKPIKTPIQVGYG